VYHFVTVYVGGIVFPADSITNLGAVGVFVDSFVFVEPLVAIGYHQVAI
jgi:pyridoxal biosynthesis lyase PdxS